MVLFRFSQPRKSIALAGLGITLACSGCASLSSAAKVKPPAEGPVQALYQEQTRSPKDKTQARYDARRESEIQQLNAVQPAINNRSTYHDPALQQMSYQPDGVRGQSLPIHNPMAAHGWSQTDAMGCPIEPQCPPEPRWPAAGANPMAPGMTACEACNTPSPEKYDDEYLCDGGDRDKEVHHDLSSRQGLDTEDTVLAFADRAGNLRIKPSNRVCIYAPRFAAVRTVSNPHEESSAYEVAGVGQRVTMRAVHTRLKATDETKREATGGIIVRSRAGGLESNSGQGLISQLHAASTHDKLLNLFQALAFVRTGRIEDTDSARLNLGLQAARFWTRQEYPVVSAKTDMALEGRFTQSTSTITGIEERDEAENLRIVKLADKTTAVSGDEIEFTIRYDNLGGREVTQVRIVDNLTPRLEYIVDSATSDLEGRLIVDDNGEGSQVLTWEISEPLKGKSGGVITFKVRVR